MRTRVDIVAVAGRSPRIAAEGGLAVRQTAPDTLRFVGAAATPLGGDTIEVSILVHPGARLDVGSIAASIALAAADRRDSTARWQIRVGSGASLRFSPEPTLVAGGADHRSRIEVDLAADAALELGEHVQLGRSARFDPADAGSRWEGGLRVDIAGHPVLRHRLALAAPESADAAGPAAGPSTGRAVSSVFRYPDDRCAEVHPARFATRMNLAREQRATPQGATLSGSTLSGSTLTTAVGDRVAATRALCAELDGYFDSVPQFP